MVLHSVGAAVGDYACYVAHAGTSVLGVLLALLGIGVCAVAACKVNLPIIAASPSIVQTSKQSNGRPVAGDRHRLLGQLARRLPGSR